MRIFLSYASQDRAVAQSIELALREAGHDVFFDRDDLPPGEEFHNRIRSAIEKSDLMVFLLSPDAVDAGSYTLTELEIAEQIFKHASGRLLPVILRKTPRESTPPVLRSVTYLETAGNIPASVAAAVHRLAVERKRRRLRKLVATFVATLVIVAVVGAGASFYLRGRAPALEITGTDGAPQLLVPAGVFTMGDDEASPIREVYLDSYYIDKYEVTTSRYAAFLKATGSTHPPDEWEMVDVSLVPNIPVVNVDWNDAQAYCSWAERRLPTEAEWEKAARGTDARRYPWGDAFPTYERANYDNKSPDFYDGGLTEVGKYPAGRSAYGAEDMAGNAAEWVSDWYSETFESGDTRNPHGPEHGDGRVIRGSGRFESGYRLDATLRYHAMPDQRNQDIGFRCARNVR